MPPPILDAVKRVENLPSMPGVAMAVLRLAEDQNASPAQFGKILATDPALTGRILGYVNSSAFSLPKKVFSIQQAVTLIGMRALKVLALSFSLVEVVRKGPKEFDYDDYWRHALTSAVAARMIAEAVERPLKDEAFVAGLLMDIGIMAAATAARKEYGPVLREWKKRGRRDEQVEIEKVGAAHPEIGAVLLRTWKIPEFLCAAVGARGGAEDGLDEQTLRLARILRAASRIAAVFCGEGDDLEEEKRRIVEWTGIGEKPLEELLKGLKSGADELGSFLTVKMGKVADYTEIRADASRKLAELGLQAEQESAAMKQSVEVAGQRQRRLLPSKPPEVEGCSIGLVYLPSERVGGDFYDFLTLPDGRVALFVGDCTGHGIEAAVVMGVAKKMVGISLRNSGDVAEGLRAANRDLHPDMAEGTFATVFAGIFDPKSRGFRFARGGHNPAYLLRADGPWQELEGKGMGLGLDAGGRFDAALEPGETTLHPGDLLLLYTDGIPEATGPDGEEYGEERMKAAAARNRDKDPQEISDAIAMDVAAFRGGAPQEDDVTLVAVMIK